MRETFDDDCRLAPFRSANNAVLVLPLARPEGEGVQWHVIDRGLVPRVSQTACGVRYSGLSAVVEKSARLRRAAVPGRIIWNFAYPRLMAALGVRFTPPGNDPGLLRKDSLSVKSVPIVPVGGDIERRWVQRDGRRAAVARYCRVMDWDEVSTLGRQLLVLVDRARVPMDAHNILMSSPEFAGTVGQTGLPTPAFFQALELLQRTGFVQQVENLYLEITDKGRVRLDQTSEGESIFDRFDPRIEEWVDIESLRSAMWERLPTEQNTFERLTVKDWRQFDTVDLGFHPRLTILTGANAAGKTTLLNILAPHFSWNAQLLSSQISKRYVQSSAGSLQSVGELAYTNGSRTSVAQAVSPGINVTSLGFPYQQVVPGIYISSHRSISGYQPLQNLPMRFSASSALLQQFTSEIQTRYAGGASGSSPLFRMKEALVSAALHGYGNIAVSPNSEAREVWEEYQDVLQRFLPASLKFRRMAVLDGDLVLETEGGSFPLEAASGGVSAMLELSWQIYLRGRESAGFTVCIDEPENHLHPELQRKIMPSLLEGFPNATFVVATHSPFVVTSTKECLVYSLRPGEDGRVSSREIVDLDAAATADETIMSVLGLDTPLPEWAEAELADALSVLSASPSVEEVRTLGRRLDAMGLSRQFPAAIEAIRNGGDFDQA